MSSTDTAQRLEQALNAKDSDIKWRVLTQNVELDPDDPYDIVAMARIPGYMWRMGLPSEVITDESIEGHVLRLRQQAAWEFERLQS